MKRTILCAILLLPFALPAEEVKGLDKEFYNAYLDGLPDEKKQRLVTLQKNLATILKRVIPREDPDHGLEFIKTLKPETLVFEELTIDSPFVRGMLKEIPGFRADKFMYIVKTGPYLVYAAFSVNPKLYITDESQRLLIRRAEPSHE